MQTLNRIANALERMAENQQAIILGAESEMMPVNSLASYEAMLANNRYQAEQEKDLEETATA